MEGSRTDKIVNFELFLRAWDDPSQRENRYPVELRRTPFGNINLTGELGNYTGYLLTRWHPQFESSVEPGVLPLVRLLVQRFHCITYTSCEGHRYPGEDLKPVPRGIGVVARSEEEAERVERLLGAACDEVREEHGEGAIHLHVFRHGIGEGEVIFPAVDLVFRRLKAATWDDYFAELDACSEHLFRALERRAPPAG